MERGPDGTELELGVVLACQPPTALSCTWRLGAPGELHTVVHLRFEPDGPGTRVELLHEAGDPPLPTWTTTVRIFESAWTHVLQSFAHHAQEAP